MKQAELEYSGLDFVYDRFKDKWETKSDYTPKVCCYACGGKGHIFMSSKTAKYRRNYRKICEECYGSGYLIIVE